MRKLFIYSLMAAMTLFFASNSAMATKNGEGKGKDNKQGKFYFKNFEHQYPGPKGNLAEDQYDIAILCVPKGDEPRTKKELKSRIMVCQYGSEICKKVKPGCYCIYIANAALMSKVPDGEIPRRAWEPNEGYFLDKGYFCIEGGQECCLYVNRGRIRKDEGQHDD